MTPVSYLHTLVSCARVPGAHMTWLIHCAGSRLGWGEEAGVGGETTVELPLLCDYVLRTKKYEPVSQKLMVCATLDVRGKYCFRMCGFFWYQEYIRWKRRMNWLIASFHMAVKCFFPPALCLFPSSSSVSAGGLWCTMQLLRVLSLVSHVDQGALCGIRHFVLFFNAHTYMANCSIKERMAMLMRDMDLSRQQFI